MPRLLIRGSLIALGLILSLTGVAALSSVLMVGFAPVAWLFGVSTSNLQFMVALHMIGYYFMEEERHGRGAP